MDFSHKEGVNRVDLFVNTELDFSKLNYILNVKIQRPRSRIFKYSRYKYTYTDCDHQNIRNYFDVGALFITKMNSIFETFINLV